MPLAMPPAMPPVGTTEAARAAANEARAAVKEVKEAKAVAKEAGEAAKTGECGQQYALVIDRPQTRTGGTVYPDARRDLPVYDTLETRVS